jgi:hypothetical protein
MQENNGQILPIQLQRLVGSTYVFEIKLDKYNFDYKIKRYTVSRIFENFFSDSAKENGCNTSAAEELSRAVDYKAGDDTTECVLMNSNVIHDKKTKNVGHFEELERMEQFENKTKGEVGELEEVRELHSMKSQIKKPRNKK